jgi:hypothetical protein
MTDDVFNEYQKIADVSRSDFIITAEERAKNPLVCEGDDFANEGNSDDPEVYVQLQVSSPPNKDNLGPDVLETTSSESFTNEYVTEVAFTGFTHDFSSHPILVRYAGN